MSLAPFGMDINGLTAADVALTDTFPEYNAAASANRKVTAQRLLGFGPSGICEFRLSLSSGNPLQSADVTGATSVFLVPFTGNAITIYDGTRVNLYHQDTQVTYNLGTLVNAQAYDLFIFDSSGTLTLEAAEWSNAVVTMGVATPGVVTWTGHNLNTGDSFTPTTTGALLTGLTANTQYLVTKIDANTFNLSTNLITLAAGTKIAFSGTQSGVHTGHSPRNRQTALIQQNGAWYKTGALTRRYLGSFQTTSTTTTESSRSKRFCNNLHNLQPLDLKVVDVTDTWNYSLAAYEMVRGQSTNMVEVLCIDPSAGMAVSYIELDAKGVAANGTGSIRIASGVGVDSGNANSAQVFGGGCTLNVIGESFADYSGRPGTGYHAMTWLEAAAATGTTTWSGDGGTTLTQAGMTGSILG